MSNNELEITHIDTGDILISVSVSVKADGGLVVFDYYAGPLAEEVYDDADVETWITFPPTAVQALHAALGLPVTEESTRAEELAAFLATEYGGRVDARRAIAALSERYGVAYDFTMWP